MTSHTEKTLPAAAEYSPGFTPEDEDQENPFRRFQYIDDAKNEIKAHLTSEELLMFAIYKNSRRNNNNIYRAWIKTHLGKNGFLSSSAITHRKKRLLCVLGHVTAMLTFKRTKNIDHKLQEILTTRQLTLLQAYEKRISLQDISKIYGYNSKWWNMCRRFRLIVDKLEESQDPDIRRYLILLGNVLRFSRKFPLSKR